MFTAGLLDSHCVSNRFWTELSARFSLPNLSLINQHRESIDSRLEIHRTPGTAPGVCVSFADELRNTIHDICKSENKSPHKLMRKGLLVKVEGDGCNVSQTISWSTLLFVILRTAKEGLHNPNVHRIILVSQAKESQFPIREAFEPVFQEISDVARKGGLQMDDLFFKLKVCLGADLKFLLLIFGIQAASSNHSCPFCFASKAEWSDKNHSASY